MQKPPFLDNDTRLYLANHTPLDFYFKQSSRDFTVEEIPLYDFSGEGEHLILKIRKKETSTHELINHISATLGIRSMELGYAGLKDKNALTTQYISLNKKLAHDIHKIENENIKILQETYHNNKIKIGHLKGNKFFIRLKKVDKINLLKMENEIKSIEKNGFPNYFGFQRFGRDGQNHQLGKQLARDKKGKKHKRMDKFFISAYQSEVFNKWLATRVALSKTIEEFSNDELAKLLGCDKKKIALLKTQETRFKLLSGDVMMHYPYGKLFLAEELQAESGRFAQKSIAPTGPLIGKGGTQPIDDALVFEQPFFDDKIQVAGARRYGVVFCDNIDGRYIEEKAHYELNFSLPKGTYATTLIECIKNQEIQRSDNESEHCDIDV